MLLTTFFPRRDCHTLPRPAVDESTLADLNFAALQARLNSPAMRLAWLILRLIFYVRAAG